MSLPLWRVWPGRYARFPSHAPSFLFAELVRQQGGSNKEATCTRTEIWGHRRRHRFCGYILYSVRTPNTNMHKYTLSFAIVVNVRGCFHVHKSHEKIWRWRSTATPLRTKQRFAWACIICIGAVGISICCSGAAMEEPLRAETEGGKNVEEEERLFQRLDVVDGWDEEMNCAEAKGAMGD